VIGASILALVVLVVGEAKLVGRIVVVIVSARISA
jgi:hypothetical protein